MDRSLAMRLSQAQLAAAFGNERLSQPGIKLIGRPKPGTFQLKVPGFVSETEHREGGEDSEIIQNGVETSGV
jgi:hypothetical protein